MTAYATSAEYAAFTGSANVTATAAATILAGAVNTLTIGAGGGYGYIATPGVLIGAPPTGTRATAAATVANGVVSDLTILDSGENYVVAPAVTIDPPEDLDRLLEQASTVIDDNTRTAIYDVDDDDLPTDTDVIAAFRDATCAQVEFWITSDEEDDILGPVDSVSLGGVSAKGRELAPRAARILRVAGLYSNDPVIL
jgi:hypothetical protein